MMKFSLRLCYSNVYQIREAKPKSLEISEERADEVLKFLEKKTDLKFKIYEQDYALCAGNYYIGVIDEDLDISSKAIRNYDWYAIEVSSTDITSKQVLEVFAAILDSGFKIYYGGSTVHIEFKSLEELMIKIDLEK